MNYEEAIRLKYNVVVVWDFDGILSNSVYYNETGKIAKDLQSCVRHSIDFLHYLGVKQVMMSGDSVGIGQEVNKHIADKCNMIYYPEHSALKYDVLCKLAEKFDYVYFACDDMFDTLSEDIAESPKNLFYIMPDDVSPFITRGADILIQDAYKKRQYLASHIVHACIEDMITQNIITSDTALIHPVLKTSLGRKLHKQWVNEVYRTEQMHRANRFEDGDFTEQQNLSNLMMQLGVHQNNNASDDDLPF